MLQRAAALDTLSLNTGSAGPTGGEQCKTECGEWRQTVESESGDREWRQRVESGDREWRVETESREWSQRVESE